MSFFFLFERAILEHESFVLCKAREKGDYTYHARVSRVEKRKLTSVVTYVRPSKRTRYPTFAFFRMTRQLYEDLNVFFQDKDNEWCCFMRA